MGNWTAFFFFFSRKWKQTNKQTNKQTDRQKLISYKKKTANGVVWCGTGGGGGGSGGDGLKEKKNDINKLLFCSDGDGDGESERVFDKHTPRI